MDSGMDNRIPAAWLPQWLVIESDDQSLKQEIQKLKNYYCNVLL